VLVVGATGSIGRIVVDEAVRQGYVVRASVRTPFKARKFPPQAEVISGDVTRPETLTDAVDGIDAIVFTLGSDGAGKVGAETVDYGGVRTVLAALGPRTAHRAHDFHRSHQSHRFMQSLHGISRLETTCGAIGACERTALSMTRR